MHKALRENYTKRQPLLVQFVQVAKTLPVEITQAAETGLTVLLSLPELWKHDHTIKETLRKSTKYQQVQQELLITEYEFTQGGVITNMCCTPLSYTCLYFVYGFH